MNHLIAKKTGRNGDYIKVLSDNSFYALPEDLDNPKEYDSDYKLEDDEWFGISDFSTKDYCIEFLTNDFNSAELNQISSSDYGKIKYLCSVQDHNYFFQKITPTQLICKKWLRFSNDPELIENQSIIVLKTTPDAVYDKDTDVLYFKKLTSITSIFKGIDTLYKEATDEDTQSFLDNSFIELNDDFSAENVKTANRKRIAMAMDTINNFNEDQKNQIFDYIHDYCGGLEFKGDEKQFKIATEEELKLLLYGIEQRFYTTPIGNERRLANSVSSL